MEISRDPRDYTPPPILARIRTRSLVIGVVALAVDCIVGLGIRHDGTQFFRSYLLAWEFWNNIAVGCLAILMMQHLTGGRWAFVIRRPLEAATRVLWLTALLGIPWLIWGIPRLYLWGNAVTRAQDEHLSHSVWLTTHGFVFRYCVYFFAWLTLAIFLNKYSARQDRVADIIVKRRLENVSAPGLVIYLLTATFSSIDWLMSLDPHWGSTMYGFILIAGQALVAICFMIVVLVILIKRPPMNALVHPQQFHDLGKLVLTFLMLWAYFAFSQYLLVWAGNLPDEINWYLRRLRGNWWWVGLALILLHFALPFGLLLSRDLKRAARRLVVLAGFVIVMRWVDLFWLIAPNRLPLRPHGTTFSWQDVLLTFGIGGLWLALYFWELGKRPLVPLYDPWFEQVVEHAGKP
jgi:hypothetical protein